MLVEACRYIEDCAEAQGQGPQKGTLIIGYRTTIASWAQALRATCLVWCPTCPLYSTAGVGGSNNASDTKLNTFNLEVERVQL